MKEKDMTLREKAEALLKNNVRSQDMLYDEIVLPSFEQGDDAIDIAFKEYHKRLGGYDAKAFRGCIHKLLNDTKDNNPELFADFADRFKFVSEYASHRNVFDKKRVEILTADTSNEDKEAIFKSLDRKRTAAHNGLIGLYNKLNEFADENKLPKPYPNNGVPFNKNNPNDRELVANILRRQDPVATVVSELLLDENKLDLPSEKMSKMTLSEQLEYWKDYQSKINQNKNTEGLVL